MRTVIYDTLGIGLAVIVFIVMAGAAINGSRRHPEFLQGEYLKLLMYCTALALVSPLLYQWASPTHISLSEAALLRVRSAGWSFTLIAYLAELGLLVGGLIAVLLSRAKRRSP